MGKPGQVGLEYMFIFAFSLVIIGVLWFYANYNVENTKWDVQLTYAKSALDNIVEVSNTIYVQGPPAQVYIYPNFPDSINAMYVNGTKVTMELIWRGDVLRNISAESISNMTGSLSKYPGQHKILVKATHAGVNLTEG